LLDVRNCLSFHPRAVQLLQVATEAEILVLRHQLNVLRQRAPRRLYLTWADRALFVWLYFAIDRAIADEKLLSSASDGVRAPPFPAAVVD
jgi:hypothetical protein